MRQPPRRHLWRHPQRIVLHTDGSDGMGGGPDAPASDRFIALYLPEASSDRDLQRKTILMPACEYRPDRVLLMLSTTREIRIRCKDALEQQADFVWTSFEPVDA